MYWGEAKAFVRTIRGMPIEAEKSFRSKYYSISVWFNVSRLFYVILTVTFIHTCIVTDKILYAVRETVLVHIVQSHLGSSHGALRFFPIQCPKNRQISAWTWQQSPWRRKFPRNPGNTSHPRYREISPPGHFCSLILSEICLVWGQCRMSVLYLCRWSGWSCCCPTPSPWGWRPLLLLATAGAATWSCGSLATASSRLVREYSALLNVTFCSKDQLSWWITWHGYICFLNYNIQPQLFPSVQCMVYQCPVRSPSTFEKFNRN